MNHVTERKDCRACHGQFEDVFDFGERPVINFGGREDLVSPLHLVLCKSCHLLQLKHTVDRDKLFLTYFYRSNANQTMRNHLQSVADDCFKRFPEWESAEIIVDIGANDGTTLQAFDRINPYLDLYGFDPGFDQATRTTLWSKDYFSKENYIKLQESILSPFKRAKLILSLAQFYDLDDPGKFLDDVKQVLAPDGLFVIEMNYLPRMLEDNRVDNISAEHLCYYSVSSLELLLARHGFEIEEVQMDEINGGVFRVYCRHLTDERDAILRYFIDEEKIGLDKLETYHKFVKRVLKNVETLHDYIEVISRYKTQGKFVDVYGASTRGLTLMQLADLDQTNIRQAVERNPAKVGTKYNGIPVVSEETMHQSAPHYLLILAPDYLGEFVKREFNVLKAGTKFIIPFDQPRILSLESI